MLFAGGARILGMKGKRYKLWWSGKADGVCGVEVMVKEGLYKKVVEIRIGSDGDDYFCSF